MREMSAEEAEAIETELSSALDMFYLQMRVKGHLREFRDRKSVV